MWIAFAGVCPGGEQMEKSRILLDAFVRGFGRILDMGCATRRDRIVRSNRTASEIDAAALAKDWLAVGKDIEQAIGAYDRGQESA